MHIQRVNQVRFLGLVGQRLTLDDRYRRFVVDRIEPLPTEKKLFCREGSDPQEYEVILRDDPFLKAPVSIGDTVNVIGKPEETNPNQYVVDKERNFLVLHPGTPPAPTQRSCQHSQYGFCFSSALV